MNLISISLHVCAVSNAALTHQFALFMLCRCKCGNCSVLLLQNISECYCCSELEGCLESTKTDLVLLDIGADVTLKCVTQHPGFNPFCVQKWSLRLAAGKFKTKGKQQEVQLFLVGFLWVKDMSVWPLLSKPLEACCRGSAGRCQDFVQWCVHCIFQFCLLFSRPILGMQHKM